MAAASLGTVVPLHLAMPGQTVAAVGERLMRPHPEMTA
eukprot:COSAG05_NODE_22738_length_262_cov_2.220859_1_plen_37_part_10